MTPRTAIAVEAGPVLKWAGGKRRLLEQYDAHFPEAYGNYFEPFVGSAAVFFHLQARRRSKRMRLTDVNAELINFYTVLRDDAEGLVKRLRVHREKHCEAHYYKVRQASPRLPVARAARLMYLNKTCYNGLYRVNSRGGFNVPMGRYKQPSILNEPRLLAASGALQSVELEVEPFQGVLEHARKGDLVYFDPPYHPLNPTSSFTSYTADCFSEQDQRALAEVFGELAARGVKVYLSNSDTPLIRELYAGFRQVTVKANRFINSRADRRDKINELLVTNQR